MRVIIDGMAWLPKSELGADNVARLREILTVQPRQTSEFRGAPDKIRLFIERGGLLGIPRGFYLENKRQAHAEEVAVTYGEPMREIEQAVRFDGPFAEQAEILDALKRKICDGRPYGQGILRAGCGSGKSVIAIEFARRLGLRTMILVHKEFFLRQWRERIEQFAPGARVGIVRQDRCEFEGCDFVIGLVQSIARDEDGSKYPDLLYSSFGLVVVDETHRISAPTWAPLIPKFKAAYRLGLTATPRRKDGAEDVFFHHLGGIVYSAKTEAMVPKIRTVRVPSRLRPERIRGKRVHPNDLPQSKVMSQLAADEFRTREIVDEVVQAVRNGRKVMVVSERLEQLRQIYVSLVDAFPKIDTLRKRPTVAPYTGEWFTGELAPSGKRKKRTLKEADLKRAESANVILATKQMVEEGLDIPALEVLIFATPMSDVEQAVGRIRRFCEPSPGKCEHLCPWRAGECKGKRDAIVTDVVDVGSGLCEAKFEKRKRFYRQIGALGSRGQRPIPFRRTAEAR